MADKERGFLPGNPQPAAVLWRRRGKAWFAKEFLLFSSKEKLKIKE
jgi:hypothetical protein